MKFKKEDKKKFVISTAKEMKKYSSIGIIQLAGKPDRLLQSIRTKLKPEAKLIMGRKTLLERILASDERSKHLVKELKGTSAILLSNSDPFELYKKLRSNSLKLAAKPKQAAPEDIMIKAGETGVAPGQAVTELKQAGIDVQIQKGKVVIAKDKVVVKKGDTVSLQMAKALHTLNVMPFEAFIVPASISAGGITYTGEVLDIDPVKTAMELSGAFNTALTLSLDLGIVNRYTVVRLIEKGYNNAMFLGTEINAYDTGIIEKVIAKAVAQASALGLTEGKKE